jgi:CHAT domain-containing protein
MKWKERNQDADDTYRNAIIKYCDSVKFADVNALPEKHYCNDILKITCNHQNNSEDPPYRSLTCDLSSSQNKVDVEDVKVDKLFSIKSLINIIKTITQHKYFEGIVFIDPFENMKNVNSQEILKDEIENRTILKLIKALPSSHDKAFAFISLAKFMLASEFAKTDKKRDKYVYDALAREALNVAQEQNNKLAIAYAEFYLAQLYEEKGRYDEAIRLTENAFLQAQNYPFLQFQQQQEIGIQDVLWGSPELLFYLKWQLGLLLKKQARIKKAEKAYQRAEDYLKLVRRGHSGLSQTFRDQVEKFYFNWAEFLLQQAWKAKGREQNWLETQAIEKIELSKIAEVRNYFEDKCIAEELEAKIQNIGQTLPNNAALFYPLLFENGDIRLILRSNQGIKQFFPSRKPPKTKKEVEQVVNAFREQLEKPTPTFEYKEAKTLYDWFIQPISEELEKIDTLVIVPHDILRTIPFAALYDNDGKQFLIEKEYALAVIPSLTLTDITKKPTLHKGTQTLLTGLAIKSQVPNNFNPLCFVPREIRKISCLLKGKKNIYSNEEDGFDACLKSSWENDCWKDKSYSITPNTALVQCLKQERIYCALGLEEYQASLLDKADVDILQDEDFTFQNVERKLHQTHYAIIHFSTHGVFGPGPKQTYLVAYDKEITMDDLESLVGITKDGPQPVELLALSACQTAVGDKRAALGLAGVAIKVGVPSVLATLWNVNDKSTSDMMIEFYRQLKNHNGYTTKAKALQNTQQWWLQEAAKDISDISYPKHPYYWAPFLLIGNWL